MSWKRRPKVRFSGWSLGLGRISDLEDPAGAMGGSKTELPVAGKPDLPSRVATNVKPCWRDEG